MGGGWLYFSAVNESFDMTIDLSSPPTVTQGDDFTITLLIQNTSSEEQKLDSIDIDLSYLDGIHIISSQPAYQDTLDLTPIFEQRSYEFLQVIPPGGTLQVQFYCRAVYSGDFSGQLDVCFKQGGSCQGQYIRTVVE
jgi:hypothetical protein